MKTIRYFAPMRGAVHKETEETDLASIRDVLGYIKTAYGKEAYKTAKSSLIVVNDVSIGLMNGKKTALNDGDVIGFLPLCGGG